MKLQQSVDIARHSPRLWWLMLTGVAAHFTAVRPRSEAVNGLLLSLAVLILCALARWMIRRGRHSAAWVAGLVVAIIGLASAVARWSADDWQPAALMALLAVQAGAFIAAEKRLHVWLIVAPACVVLLFSALRTHSPLFLLCAAAFTFVALSLLGSAQRDQRDAAAAFEPTMTGERRSGGLVFAGLTLLLAIPVYLFVPQPSLWSEADALSTKTVAPPTAVSSPAAPPLLPLLPEPEPGPSQQQAAPAPPAPAPFIEGSKHIAQPETGDYGTSFGILDVQRRKLTANEIVMYARSSHAISLRGRIYDRFAEHRWSRTLLEPQRLELENDSVTLVTQPAGPTRVQQSIEVAMQLDPAVLHAPGLQRLQFPARSLMRYDDGVLLATEPLRVDTLYSVDSRLTLSEGRYLLQEPPPLDLGPYLQADGASQRLRELAHSVSAGSSTTLARALALERHLRTHYAYSYETVAQQNYTPLDWFLFDARRGHCEFFASALAMMLRSVGIPSRLATGFALDAPNPFTGFHEVRAFDGHAWVEAYLDGAGWLMLEPTPFYPLPQVSPERSIAAQLDRYLQRRAETRELLTPQRLETRLMVLTRDLWRTLRAGQRTLTDALSAVGWLLPLLVAALLLGLMMVYLLGVAATDWFDNLRIRRSLAVLPAPDDRTTTLLLAAALQRMTTPRSFARRQDWTLREYADQLSRAAAMDQRDAAAVLHEFIETFDAARYNSNPEYSTAAHSKMVDCIRAGISHNRWPRLRAAMSRLKHGLRRVVRRH